MKFVKLSIYILLFSLLDLSALGQSIEISYSNGVGFSPYKNLYWINTGFEYENAPFSRIAATGWGLGSLGISFTNQKMKNHSIGASFSQFVAGTTFKSNYRLTNYNGQINSWTRNLSTDIYAANITYSYRQSLGHGFYFVPNFSSGLIIKSLNLENNSSIPYLYSGASFAVPTPNGDKTVSDEMGFALQTNYNWLMSIGIPFRKQFGKGFFIGMGLEYLVSPFPISDIRISINETDNSNLSYSLPYRINIIRFTGSIGYTIKLKKE